MFHLLTPKPQKKHIDRSSRGMVAKYQKLHRHSQRIFPSNRATLTLRTVFATNSGCRFLGGRRRFASVAYANSITLAILPLDTTTGAIFQVVKGGKSLINSMSSLLFSAIVAVVEVKVDRRHVPKVDFREFQELKAQNDGSLAKEHI